jgi:hypothetical protein
MIGVNLRLIFRPALFIFLLIISGCNEINLGVSGYLEGKISIGPICPVERIPPDPACLPTAETYKAYPVVILNTDGKTKVSQISPSIDGTYITTLEPGSYMISLDKDQNSIGGSNLPAWVTIVSNDTTILNINIDTGIR